MDVTIKGKGHVSLNKNDFIASGGEGQIFRKNNIAFKIYSDPKKMLPVDKIRELSVLTMPEIIRPQDIILDGHHAPIGYTMKYVKDSYALCQLFTKAFRDRMGIKPPAVLDLVRKLQGIVDHCHAHNILIVDLNEMNFMVDDNFDTVYAIDCDSYQTPNFPATAIMESIRDRHNKKFSTGTDWFSFGVVSFQMFIGVHPYKGKHPKVKTLDERMEKNISVFNDSVSIPAVCYPLDSIPQDYAAWFKAVFEQGKRVPPPSGVQHAVVIIPHRTKVPGSNHFTIRKIRDFGTQHVVRFDPATRHAVTDQGVYFDSNMVFDFRWFLSKPPLLAMTPGGKPVAAWLSDKMHLLDLSRGKEINLDMAAERLMSYDGRLYAQNGGSILEISFVEPAGTVLASSAEICGVLENATKLFEGVVFQDVLGSCYCSFFPHPKQCFQPRIKELDGHRIVDAKFDGGVLMVVSFHAGKYDRFVFRFDEDFGYDIYRVENDVSPVAPNFVTLPNGVCVMVNNEKEEMEIFHSRKGSTNAKLFADPVLEDIRLFRDGTKVLFSKGNGNLYSIEVKP